VTIRLRREPPRFRSVVVRTTERLSPWLVRITLAGPDLEGFAVDQPAASVRLLLPSPGSDGLVMPAWNGNEFLLADGRRPIIRTFTPVRVDSTLLELDVDVVLHGEGAASQWASGAAPGDAAAVSGPGRGYAVDADAPAFLLAGDESAMPAIRQLLGVLPAGTPVEVLIEIAHADARLDGLPARWLDLPTGADPGDALVAAVTGAEFVNGTNIWVAGEAAAVQRIRRHLFEERGVSRKQATVRGYWKRGRAGEPED
jgi:NADPH-dependent ferric siderophore reductase